MYSWQGESLYQQALQNFGAQNQGDVNRYPQGQLVAAQNVAKNQADVNPFLKELDYEIKEEVEKTKKEKLTMFNELKKYIEQHRDIVFTILCLFLVDTCFLNGALKSKLESLLHRSIDKLDTHFNKQVSSNETQGK